VRIYDAIGKLQTTQDSFAFAGLEIELYDFACPGFMQSFLIVDLHAKNAGVGKIHYAWVVCECDRVG